MMGLGVWLHELVSPIMEAIAPYLPGDIFPYFFTVGMFQRAFGEFRYHRCCRCSWLVFVDRNMALIGDGIATLHSVAWLFPWF